MTTPHATVTGIAVPYIAGMFVVGSASTVNVGGEGAGSGGFSSIPFLAPSSPPAALASVGDLLVGIAWIGHADQTLSAPGGYSTVQQSVAPSGCSCDILVCTAAMVAADVTTWNAGASGTIASATLPSATIRYNTITLRFAPPAVIGAHGVNIVPSPPAGVAPTVMIPPDASGSGIPFYYYVEGTDNDEPVPDAGPTAVFTASAQGILVYGNALAGLHVGRLRLGGA